MPIYIQLANLLVFQKSVLKKYDGNLSRFLTDTSWQKSELDSMDDELVSFAAMNPDEFDMDILDEKGFVFNHDYTVITRYSADKNFPDWLQHNGVFVWHSTCGRKQVELAMKYSNYTAKEFFEKKLYAAVTKK